jgi:hypothetical protein
LQNKKTIWGSNLIEYIIPVALIALVAGAGLFIIFSDNSLIRFFVASSNIQIDEASGKAVMGKAYKSESSSEETTSEEILLNPAAGDYGGTPENPVQVCEGGKCTIDYGTFILTGLPENFNEFIQNNGASGGISQLADLLDQIADQLLQEGKREEALEVRKLANLGHGLGATEKEIELQINNCNYDAGCIKALMTNAVSIPDGFDETYYEFPSNHNYSSILGSMCVGCARSYKISDDPQYYDKVNSNYPGYLFTDQIDIVSNLSGIDNSVKNVIKELSWTIGVLGEDFAYNINFANGEHQEHEYIYFNDPLTAEGIKKDVPSDPLLSLKNYDASNYVNLNSSLICASGAGNDDLKACH